MRGSNLPLGLAAPGEGVPPWIGTLTLEGASTRGPGGEEGCRSPWATSRCGSPVLMGPLLRRPQFGHRQRGWHVLRAAGSRGPGPQFLEGRGARGVRAGSAEFPGCFGSGPGGPGLFRGRSSKCESQQMLQEQREGGWGGLRSWEG